MAFSFDYPEVRPYIKEMANAFLTDLENGTRGERFLMRSEQGETLGFTGTKRNRRKP
jgi:hypothetical protein